MAERLTRNSKFSFYNQDNLDAMYDKLAELEDIMEEFNISSIDELHEILCWEQEQRKELDKIYNVWEKYGCKTLQEVDDLLQDGCDTMCIMEENKKLETDRDTWKRACELACDVLRDINYKIYNEDRIDFENTFYQQAKKEGNNESNND